MSALPRRRLFGIASALAALAAAPPVLASVMPAAGSAGDGGHFVRIRVDAAPLLPAVRELTELLPLAADLDDGARASLVQVLESGRHIVDVVHLDRFAADGTRERLVVFQPSDRLLFCVAALRALRRDGDVVHQAHFECPRRLSAPPTMAGRVPGVEHRRASGRGQSFALDAPQIFLPAPVTTKDSKRARPVTTASVWSPASDPPEARDG